jgi:hypothetical protein
LRKKAQQAFVLKLIRGKLQKDFDAQAFGHTCQLPTKLWL